MVTADTLPESPATLGMYPKGMLATSSAANATLLNLKKEKQCYVRQTHHIVCIAVCNADQDNV
jgi:hypothetical protein